MVSLVELWAPILLAALFVFVASSVIHMFLGYHAADMRGVPDEPKVMEALRAFNLPPGDYGMPKATSSADLKNPAFLQKMQAGPVIFMTVLPNGPVQMGTSLALWFLYCVVVGIFAGYIAGRALGPGADYLSVFRFAGATAFVGYTLALWQQTIWYKRSVATTLRSTFDGLIYALLSGGCFGWLWPRG